MAVDMNLKYSIDLDTPLLETPARTLLMEGDDGAQTVNIDVKRGGKAADLTGCTAMGAMTVATGETVIFPAVVSGSAVTAQLPRACYAVPGAYMLLIRLSGDGVVARTLLYLTGRVARSGEGPAIDPDSVLPSITELREAAKQVETAVDAAMTVAGMTVQTTTLAAGSSATARYADGVLYLGLPQGATGAGQPRNLLDNSDFRNPVNQRGNASLTGKGYFIDRWENDSDSNVASIDASGLIASGANGIRQSLEHKHTGETMTLAYKLASGIVSCVSFTVPAATSTIWIATDYSNNMFAGVMQSSSGQLSVYIRTASSPLVWAALYEGAYTADTLPTYQPRGYAAELAECMRYYQTIPGLTHIPGVTNSATSFGAKYQLQPMRIAPTAVLPSGVNVSVYTGDFSSTTGDYNAQCATQRNQLTLNIALTAASFVAYKPGILTFPADIVLTADL